MLDRTVMKVNYTRILYTVISIIFHIRTSECSLHRSWSFMFFTNWCDDFLVCHLMSLSSVFSVSLSPSPLIQVLYFWKWKFSCSLPILCSLLTVFSDFHFSFMYTEVVPYTNRPFLIKPYIPEIHRQIMEKLFSQLAYTTQWRYHMPVPGVK